MNKMVCVKAWNHIRKVVPHFKKDSKDRVRYGEEWLGYMNHSSNRVIMFSLYYVCVSVCLCENGAFGGYMLGTEVGRYNKKEAPKIILSPIALQTPKYLFQDIHLPHLPTQ